MAGGSDQSVAANFIPVRLSDGTAFYDATGGGGGGGNATIIGPLGNQTAANSVSTYLNGGNVAISNSITLVSVGASAAVSLTRTNDTNPYTANDVIGAATGSTAALTFALASGQFLITSVSLEIDIAAIVSGMSSFNLELYNVTPPSALGDNAPWDLPSGDRASYLGVINLGSPVDVGSTLYVYTAQLNQQIKLASANLFGYLTTVGAWTPAASSVFVVTLYGISL